ncbi:nickel-dependent hydrogenase large subunit [Geoalkalibacter halelectricus]|uniref:Nickel-dependent hydrogenase large subunit n=1 Tax=Geoalkalibacter halelectricus TaxID=2847045 RepID=A0ABY5ZJM3_9BACT|nr:nickel-dependent hydrogenase large subunit [Geoalkalibacter halelectricus]MDO3377747.1 nickel-dependent hydrogenase large subunit [Geoalkalibacter halelectricus]UWZ78659.1 nickel-dependent hydrogenase large subunit [Geoalkalibacter halelectricus]
MGKIIIDPVTRIEGHLKIEAVLDNGVVKEARSSGMMYRGLENILLGRDPRDAARIMQRICGVCPTSHGLTATFALDEAYGVNGNIPANGRILRNLIQGANYVQSHILHFYQLAALDYVDVTAAADYSGSDPNLRKVKEFIARGNLGPFLPRYEGDYRLTKEENRAAVSHYVEALNLRRMAHEALAVFGGKMPHNMSIVAGGVTADPTIDKIAAYLWKIEQLSDFIEHRYLPDVLMVARRYSDYFGIGAGCKQFMSFGVFDLDHHPDLTKRKRYLPQGIVRAADFRLQPMDPNRITEQVENSWYRETGPVHPYDGSTEPDRDKAGAYSWCKSPRYAGEVMEVGPLARMLAAYAGGHDEVKAQIDGVLAQFNAGPEALFSVLGRHAARAIECKLVADQLKKWVLELQPGNPVCAEYSLDVNSRGMGLHEAPRGALGHWIVVEGGKTKNYQAVVPTTWNMGPADAKGVPGPVEQSLIGTRVKDQENPFELVRIVRSYDPCLSCAVHVVTPKGRDLGRFVVAPE